VASNLKNKYLNKKFYWCAKLVINADELSPRTLKDAGETFI